MNSLSTLNSNIFISKVKLPEDVESKNHYLNNHRYYENHRNSMLENGIEISEQITPALDSCLNKVCDSLSFDRNKVVAFVYASPNINADCTSIDGESCLIRITSSLVSILDDWELMFVLGHELGHYLLGHIACHDGYNEKQDLEILQIQRSRELSADRVGYLACGSLEESIQAMMKIASGLTTPQIRFDIAKFISQIKSMVNIDFSTSLMKTHPSLLIRARSILWFSLRIKNLEELQSANDDDIKWANNRVILDLEKYIDGGLRQRINELKEEIIMLKICSILIADIDAFEENKLKIKAQKGHQYYSRIEDFLSLYQRKNITNTIEMKFNESISELYKNYPKSASNIEEDAIRKAYLVFEYRP